MPNFAISNSKEYIMHLSARIIFGAIAGALAFMPLTAEADPVIKYANPRQPAEISDQACTEIFLDGVDDGMGDFTNAPTAMAADVIDYAAKFLGRRYVHATHGPNTFDCSGFTHYVFKNFDINLSPGSQMQATQGRKISRSEIRPGDLIFFAGRDGNTGRVGHVGMAVSVDDVTGDIRFIHANVKNGISYQNLSTSYYAKRYVMARRVLPD